MASQAVSNDAYVDRRRQSTRVNNSTVPW